MKIQAKEGKQNGVVGLTITCTLQSKYQPAKKKARVKSASCTIHTDKSPAEIIEQVKKALED